MADKKNGKKGKKFPMRSMITSNMRLRYSLGERENTESSKPAHSKINVQHPQQALITRENKCRGRRISKNVKEIAAAELSCHNKLKKKKRTNRRLGKTNRNRRTVCFPYLRL